VVRQWEWRQLKAELVSDAIRSFIRAGEYFREANNGMDVSGCTQLSVGHARLFVNEC